MTVLSGQQPLLLVILPSNNLFLHHLSINILLIDPRYCGKLDVFVGSKAD